MEKSKRMDEDTLRGVLRQHLEESTNYYDSTYARDRVKADQLYAGEPMGNEIKGRSHVVSRDVAESVDTLMPSLMRIFTTSDDPVRFDPTKPGQEQLADQMTDYASYIWNQRNEGYSNYYQWFKAALLYRIGVLKIWWDATPEIRKEKYQGLSEDQYNALLSNPDIELDEEDIYPDPAAIHLIENHYKQMVADAIVANQQPPEQPQIDEDQLPKLYDCKVSRTISDGRVRIKPVPTEEFIFHKLSTSADEMPFCAHRTRMTKSELREMGYDEALIDEITADAFNESMSYEAEQRFTKENMTLLDDMVNGDPSLDAVWVYECYGKVDFDGDGIAEYRKITVAGSTSEFVVLENIDVEDHPFCVVTPIPLPFKMVGQSITDQTKEIQEVKTAVTRQLMDNFYLNTHARPILNPENVNMDDVLNPRPGAPIRAKNPQTDIVYAQPPDIGQTALAAIEYWDTVREVRTGVTRYNQGLNADELNPTATGASLSMNAGNMRMELIARNFSETGVKRAFKRIYSLVSMHQSRPDIVKLRGNFATLTPTEWDANFDVTVHVGLGTGNRDQEFTKIMGLIQLDQAILTMQAQASFPPGMGPVVTMANVYHKLRRAAEVAGLKNPDLYYTDPSAMMEKMAQQPPPPKQPDPRVQAAQIDAQGDLAALQERKREFDAKHALEMQKAQATLALQQQKLNEETKIKKASVLVDAAAHHLNAHAQGVQDGHAAARDLMNHYTATRPPAPPQNPNQ